MNPLSLDNFFDKVPEGPFFKALLSDLEYPWQAVSKIGPALEAHFVGRNSQGSLRANHRSELPEPAYYQQSTQFLTEDLVDRELMIHIGAGTLIEAGVTLKPKTVIESGCQLREGAYIRGNFYAAQGSVIGHTTEVKNSVFFNHVEAGHFTYVGDSLIGANSNLGAGTKVSNLEFRTTLQKQEEVFPELFLNYQGKRIATGLQKFGAVLGEGTEIGCNGVINPLVFLGKGSWVLPCLSLPKGVYPPASRLYSLGAAKAARL